MSFPWNSIASFNVNGFPFLVNIYDSVSKIKDEQTNVRQSVFLRKHLIAADLETSTPRKLSYLERLMLQGPEGLSLRDQWLDVERLKRFPLYNNSFFFPGKSQCRSGLKTTTTLSLVKIECTNFCNMCLQYGTCSIFTCTWMLSWTKFYK